MRNLSGPLVLSLCLVVASSCGKEAGSEGSGSESEASSASSSSGTAGSEESGASSSAEGTTAEATSAEATSAEATTGDGDGDGTTGDGDGDAECTVDADCELQNDCCGCEGHPQGTETPTCPQNCLIPICDSIGISEAACVAGQCTIKKLNCDERTVECDVPPPDCGDGTRPLIENGCWEGSCVVEAACDYVSRCSVCTERELCVTESLNAPGGPWIKCVPTPADCGTDPDCACAGDDYCDDGIFDSCSDGDNGITCACTAC